MNNSGTKIIYRIIFTICMLTYTSNAFANDWAYWQSNPDKATQRCDETTAHPDDPLKPHNISGVRNDADIDIEYTGASCHYAYIANQDDPRYLFQNARSILINGQIEAARHRFSLAYKSGSEISGVYLAKLPPPPTDDYYRNSFINERNKIIGSLKQPSFTREQVLMGSFIIISSAALLNIIAGNARVDTSRCSGNIELNPYTHEISCNGFIIGTY